MAIKLIKCIPHIILYLGVLLLNLFRVYNQLIYLLRPTFLFENKKKISNNIFNTYKKIHTKY